MVEANRKLNIEVAFKDSLSRPLTASEKNLARFGAFARGTFKTLSSAVFNLRTALVSMLAAYSVNAIADRADAMAKLAETTGDNVENISELAAVFGQNNVQFEEFSGLIVKLAKAQRAALSGTTEVASAFDALGINLEELAALAPAQLFERMAEGLQQFSDTQSKLRVISEILPKDAFKALPTIGQGVLQLQEQILRVRSLGATVTKEQAAAADAWGDALGEIKIAVEGVVRSFIKTYGPETTALLQGVAKFISENKDEIIAIVKQIGALIYSVITGIIKAIIRLIELIETFSGTSLLDPKALADEKRLLDDQIKSVKEWTAATEEARAAMRASGQPLRLGGSETAFSADQLDQYAGQLESLNLRLTENLRKQGMTLGETMRDALDGIEQQWDQTADKIRNSTQEIASDTAKAFAVDKAKQGLDAFSNVVKSTATGLSQVMTTVAARVKTVFQGATEDQKKLAAAIQDTNDKLEKTNEDLKRLQETPNTVAAGFSKRLESLRDSATNFARTVGEGFADLALSGIDRFSDAIANVVTGTMSAKEAFKEFAKGVLADVARMIAKFIALGIIKTIFGLEDGGVMPGGVEDTVPVRKYAKGGIARRPQLALFGEGKTAEAFVPLPDNRSIPVTFTGNQGSGGGVVNVNITAMDSRDVTRVLTEHSGLLKNIWVNQAERNVAMRQSVRKAAS